MSKELDDLFKDVDLNDISDLDDINIDKVDEILGKYNLDDISADATHADKIINEAYAMVNEKDDTSDGVDLSKEELDKLHEEIFAEVESTVKDAKEKAGKKENSKRGKKTKEDKNIIDSDDSEKINENTEDNKTDNEIENNIGDEEVINDNLDESYKSTDDIVNKEKITDKIANGFKKLFYNVQDPEYEKQQRKLERKEQRKKEAQAKEKEKAKEEKAAKDEEKKKKAAEDAAAKKKEKEEAKKKKDEIKKKKLEDKKAKKEAKKKEEDNEPVGKINKLGATVVFLFVGLILLAVIGYSKSLKINYKEQAKMYLSKGNYEQAYLSLIKDKNVDEKSDLYRQIKLLQTLNQQISYYDSNIALFEREKALDALIKGVEIYDTDLVNAKRLSIEKEYELIYKDIKKYLKQEFNITDEQVRELIEINNSEDYSNRIKDICKNSNKKNNK